MINLRPLLINPPYGACPMSPTFAYGPAVKPYVVGQIIRKGNFWYRVIDTTFFNRVAILRAYKPWEAVR